MPKNTNSIFKLKDGRKFAYCEYGDANGKPIFYFHGWPASRLSGSELDLAARKLGVRVISPDRPGFGLSTYKVNRTLLDWPNDVIELANQLKIGKFTVIGISGGGPYATVCAHKLKDRVTKTAIVVGLSPIVSREITKGIFFMSRIGWKNYHQFPFLRTIASLIGALEFKYFPIIGKIVGFQAKEDRQMLKNKKEISNFASSKEAYRQGIKGPALDLKI